MRVSQVARSLCLNHPLLWVLLGVPLFMHLSVLPVNSWNVEMNIARNLLDGFGFVDAPLDPPVLWRPPLAVAVLVPIESFVHDPHLIYSTFGTLTLVGFMIGVFYLMKMLGGRLAAHFSLLLVLATPAVTSVVSHQLQMLSYLLMFSLVTLAILATLWSWRQSNWRRDIVAGLCWGAAFLTRPETMPLLLVSLITGFAFRRALGIARNRACWSLLLQLGTFLAIFGPSWLIFRIEQQRYNLAGQESLFTFYAGAHFASNQLTGDVDGEGYMETVVRYGSPGKYHNSLLRFVAAHPEAAVLRVRQNLVNFKRLIGSHFILNIWDCLAFLLFSTVLTAAKPPPIRGTVLVCYFSLLLLSSPYFLFFHVDARYPLLLTVVFMLWISTVSLVFWTAVGARRRLHWAWRWLPTASLVLLCAFKLQHSFVRTGERRLDIAPWQQLAVSFRANVKDEGTPVVGFMNPDGTTLSGGDSYWFSYFARTALPWCGDPDCDLKDAFPRSRIYSFLGKPQQYLWAPDERVAAIPGSPILVVQHLNVGGLGMYSLLRFFPH